MTRLREDRLGALERQLQITPRPDAIPRAAREYLRTLTAEQLEAVERLVALLWRLDHIDVRPSEMLTDRECVEAVRRLCHPERR